MFTPVVAWLALVAVTVAAVLFGQTARTGRRRRRSRRRRLGLFLSLSGPWLALLAAVGAGALTGRWLAAAAGGVAAVIVVALLGLVLAPH
ncbi:MAG TPA: hypothetical protein VGN47_14340 [Blastococcus sp.]|nr:hypothetical protein [Blastococcus sp.]